MIDSVIKRTALDIVYFTRNAAMCWIGLQKRFINNICRKMA